jgi:hypothetical protein
MSLFKRGNGTREYDPGFGKVKPEDDSPYLRFPATDRLLLETLIAKTRKHTASYAEKKWAELDALVESMSNVPIDLKERIQEHRQNNITENEFLDPAKAVHADLKDPEKEKLLPKEQWVNYDLLCDTIKKAYDKARMSTPTFDDVNNAFFADWAKFAEEHREDKTVQNMNMIYSTIVKLSELRQDPITKATVFDATFDFSKRPAYAANILEKIAQEPYSDTVVSQSFALPRPLFVNAAPRFITDIFLGGTVASQYRGRFIEEYATLHLDGKAEVFNPIVKDWTPEAIVLEDSVKARAGVVVFAIAPSHTGFYSFVELMDMAVKHPNKKIILCFLTDEGDWTPAQLKSNAAIVGVLNSYKNISSYNATAKKLAQIVGRIISSQYGMT